MYFIMNSVTGEFFVNADGYIRIYKDFKGVQKSIKNNSLNDNYSCYELSSSCILSIDGFNRYSPEIKMGLSDKDLRVIKETRYGP